MCVCQQRPVVVQQIVYLYYSIFKTNILSNLKLMFFSFLFDKLLVALLVKHDLPLLYLVAALMNYYIFDKRHF